MASKSVYLAHVLISYFSLLGNRYLFWGGLEPYLQLTRDHEADKTHLQVPCRNKSRLPQSPSPLQLSILVNLPGQHLTPLCPHAPCVSSTQDVVPTEHPPCPHSTCLKLCTVLFATSLPGGLLLSTAKLKCPFYIKPVLSL